MNTITWFTLILILAAVGCKNAERNFFQSMHETNLFLDTFSLANLKGVGFVNHPVTIQGREYYEFNHNNNALLFSGFFRREDNKIFMLPSHADSEIIFIDLSALSKAPEAVIQTKTNIYIVRHHGLITSHTHEDSAFQVEITTELKFSQPETLVFKVDKNLDLISLERINCKRDTLEIIFKPDQRIFLKSINQHSLCL